MVTTEDKSNKPRPDGGSGIAQTHVHTMVNGNGLHLLCAHVYASFPIDFPETPPVFSYIFTRSGQKSASIMVHSLFLLYCGHIHPTTGVTLSLTVIFMLAHPFLFLIPSLSSTPLALPVFYSLFFPSLLRSSHCLVIKVLHLPSSQKIVPPMKE